MGKSSVEYLVDLLLSPYPDDDDDDNFQAAAEYTTLNTKRVACLTQLFELKKFESTREIFKIFTTALELRDKYKTFKDKTECIVLIKIRSATQNETGQYIVEKLGVYKQSDKGIQKYYSSVDTDEVALFNDVLNNLFDGSDVHQANKGELEAIVQNLEKIRADELVSPDSGGVFTQLIVDKKLDVIGYGTALANLKLRLENNQELCLAFYHFFITVFPNLFHNKQPYVFVFTKDKELEEKSLFHHYKKENDGLFENGEPIKNEIAGKLCYFIYHEAMDKTTDSATKTRLAGALDAVYAKALKINQASDHPTTDVRAFM